ncbi:MAG: ATP-binding protein [Spirochaetes bacterium]|nr:ATP-binding protein [Spirochaetota bacterium]
MKDVLIIEDDAHSGVLKTLLKHEGYVVVEKTDVAESIHEIEQNRFSVIIADVNKIADLTDFWKEKLEAAALVPIILTCDVTRVEETLFPIKQNVYDIIVKPYDAAEVKKVVADAREYYLRREQAKEIFPYLTAALTIVLPSTVKSVGIASTYIRQILVTHGFGRDTNDMAVACEEAMMNAHLHGNAKDPKKNITLKIRIDSRRAAISIGDDGPGFDYKNAIAGVPARTNDVYRGSGRGIALIHMHTDRFSYRCGGTVIVLIKNRR